MELILTIIQVVVGVLLVAAVLLQQKGSGLGAAFGGSNAVYTTRRGADLVLFKVSIALSILFFVVALLSIVL